MTSEENKQYVDVLKESIDRRFRIGDLESERDQLIGGFEEIQGYLLEAIKPWDVGHDTVFNICEKYLKRGGRYANYTK